MKKNKCVCLFVCLHRVKKTFSMIFYFRAHCRKNMVLVGIKSQKNIVSFRVQRSKNIFYDFLFRAIVEKHGLVGIKSQKNIVSFRVQRSKKHFLWFSSFVPISRKNMVLVGIKSQKTLFPSGFKGQKNIFYDFLLSCRLVEKTWSWSGSKVKKHCFLPGSKVKKTFFTKTSKSRFSRRRKVQWWTTVSFRGQKNINFRVQRSKKHFL